MNKEFFGKIKPIFIPTLVMMVICIVITGALAGTNLVTKEKINLQAEKQQTDSMKEVLPASSYETKKTTMENNEYTYYVAVESGKAVGKIFVTSQKGYGGDVKVMTAVLDDGTVKAVKVLDASSETPGLGQNTANPEWYSQFGGLDGKKDINLVKNGANKESNEINAVTGATISSTAVKNAVNTAIKINSFVSKEGADNE